MGGGGRICAITARAETAFAISVRPKRAPLFSFSLIAQCKFITLSLGCQRPADLEIFRVTHRTITLSDGQQNALHYHSKSPNHRSSSPRSREANRKFAPNPRSQLRVSTGNCPADCELPLTTLRESETSCHKFFRQPSTRESQTWQNRFACKTPSASAHPARIR